MTDRRTLRATLVVALAAGLSVVTPTSPASGVVSGQETVSETSARDGTDVKSVTATCPPGKRVIGAGTEFEPGGAVVLEGMSVSTGSVVATAQENRDQPTWSLKAHAFCADKPAGYRIVSATSPTDGASPKSVTATCPPGRTVIGTGAEISGGNGSVVVDELRPRADTVTATGDNIGDYDDPWSVTAQAICVNPLTGQQIVTAISDPGSAPTRLAQADCPSGKRRLGSGFDIIGGSGEVGVIQLLPVQVGILATAIEHSEYDGNWRVRAFAICGGLNLQTVETRSGTDSTSPKSAVVACPSGKQLVGTGFHLGGQVPSFAMADGVTPSPSGVTVVGSEREPTTGTWSVAAKAVCANPPPGHVIVAATSPTNSATSKSVTATCPVGKQVIGTAGEIDAGAGQVVLDDAVPSRTAVTAAAHEDDDGTTEPWSVTAYAICANPLADQQIITVSTPSSSSAVKSATATCPSDTRLVGTGFRIDGGLGEVHLQQLSPSPTNVTLTANEDPDGTTTSWSATVYAVCATP